MLCPIRILGLILAFVFFSGFCAGQELVTVGETESNAAESDADLQPPANVEIDPVAEDSSIAERLSSVLLATNWFEAPRVVVDQGVVFLSGKASSEEHKQWAGNLARNTESVVAVVNRMEILPKPIWDLQPAWRELRQLAVQGVQSLPLIAIALGIGLLAWLLAIVAGRSSRRLLHRRMDNRLLINVMRRAIAIPIIILGVYLALRVSGLTGIAATVVGGTGLVGLIIGIAFRDIAENFLASILISVQRPFVMGDLIEVEGHLGFVQTVTMRGTLLMTLDGNHVQLPNAIIYKSVIQNRTANPNVRCDFILGIDYADSIARAQQVILDVLQEHDAVLADPGPMILVDRLGAATVNLRVYFWLNGQQHSLLKVRSSVIRLTKLAVENAGLTMPDEAREIIFPKGVPVEMHGGKVTTEDESEARLEQSFVTESAVTKSAEADLQPINAAENGLLSEAVDISQQAKNSRSPERGENLLESEKSV